ncbi:MAG: hypothetical protein ABR585_00715, partial [Gemmatimonadaceae bacterium]
LPLSSFRGAHPAFGEDILDWLEPARSVSRRDLPGGTGPSAVATQLNAAHQTLKPFVEAARGNELFLRAV